MRRTKHSKLWFPIPPRVIIAACCLMMVGTFMWWRSAARTWNIGYAIVALDVSADGSLLTAAETTPERWYSGALSDQQPDRDTQLVRVRDTATGHIVLTLKGHSDDVLSVAFSPDGRLVASSSFDHTVKVWNIETESLLVSFTVAPATPRVVEFSPDGRYLLAATERGTTIWTTDTWRVQHKLLVGAYVFDPRSRFVAGWDGMFVNVWRVSDGQLIRQLPARYSESNITWSPDGEHVAFGMLTDLEVWRVTDGQRVATLTGHTNVINSVAWSHDGHSVATGSGAPWSVPRGGADPTIRLWSTKDWHLKDTVRAHSADVRALTFTPDNQWLVSGSLDSTIRWWLVK